MACPKEDYKYQNFLKFFNPTEKIEKIGIALFGLGRAGTIHLSNVLSNARVNLLYVVEENPGRGAQMQNGLGLSHVKFVGCDKLNEVLSDPKVQAVLIATPTQSHQHLVVSALNAGKAVFCEKPIANDVADVKKCYQTAEDKKLPLLCAFNRRFDPVFGNIQERARKGELGKIHMVKTCSRDSPLPSLDYLRISNGIFHDCAVHDIDLVCWVLGEFPCRVFASATAHRPEIAGINDHDTVAIHLTFPSGAMALIDLSRFSVYGYDQRLEVFGPGGMLRAENQNTLPVGTFANGLMANPPIQFSFASRYDEAYKRELDHFLNVVQGKESMKITGEETVAICRIALACEESVKTGVPVDIIY